MTIDQMYIVSFFYGLIVLICAAECFLIYILFYSKEKPKRCPDKKPGGVFFYNKTKKNALTKTN